MISVVKFYHRDHKGVHKEAGVKNYINAQVFGPTMPSGTTPFAS